MVLCRNAICFKFYPFLLTFRSLKNNWITDLLPKVFNGLLSLKELWACRLVHNGTYVTIKVFATSTASSLHPTSEPHWAFAFTSY